MNEERARELSSKYIEGCTITGIEDFGDIFAVNFVNDEYYLTKDILSLAVGAGPIIIIKDTEEIFRTGTGFTTQFYINAYRESGDVYATPSNTVEIQFIGSGVKKKDAILKIKKIAGCDAKVARDLVVNISKGKSERIALLSTYEAETAVKDLAAYGFIVKQLWSNQC